SLLVSSFLVPLFLPNRPPSPHPQQAGTRALRPALLPSAWAPIHSSRPAPRQPRITAPNIETAAVLSRLQRSPPSARRLNSWRGAGTASSPPRYTAAARIGRGTRGDWKPPCRNNLRENAKGRLTTLSLCTNCSSTVR